MTRFDLLQMLRIDTRYNKASYEARHDGSTGRSSAMGRKRLRGPQGAATASGPTRRWAAVRIAFDRTVLAKLAAAVASGGLTPRFRLAQGSRSARM